MLRYSLDEAATVELVFGRRVTGRRSGGKCKPQARRGRRCAFYKRVRASTVESAQGVNLVPLRPEIARTAGRYRVVATATDAAGNRSLSARKTFKVERR